MNFNLKSIFTPIPQDEPLEGRAKIILLSGSGRALVFSGLGENYVFNSDSINAQGRRLSALIAVWVNAQAVNVGDTLFVSNGDEVIAVPGGSQGFFPFPCILPVTVQISCTVNAGGPGTGIATVILYNYNVQASGTVREIAGHVAQGGYNPVIVPHQTNK